MTEPDYNDQRNFEQAMAELEADLMAEEISNIVRESDDVAKSLEKYFRGLVR